MEIVVFVKNDTEKPADAAELRSLMSIFILGRVDEEVVRCLKQDGDDKKARNLLIH
jgi:hypothetical protein